MARKGGDQFLLLLADLEREGSGDLDAALIRSGSVAQRIHESLREPFEIDGTELYVSVSVGVSLFPQDAPDAGTLMRNAETAMHESKKAGPAGYVVSLARRRRPEVEALLRHAAAQGRRALGLGAALPARRRAHDAARWSASRR